MNPQVVNLLFEVKELKEQLDRVTRLMGTLYKVCARLEQLHLAQLKNDAK